MSLQTKLDEIIQKGCGGDAKWQKVITTLEGNLDQIGTVREWAEEAGYNDPKLFSLHFWNHFGLLPIQVFTYIRLKSIIVQLRQNSVSHKVIARLHSLGNGKNLNSFFQHHIGSSPSNIKYMTLKELEAVIEKFESKIMEKNSGL